MTLIIVMHCMTNRQIRTKFCGAQEVGSLAAAQPAKENRTPVRLISGENSAPQKAARFH